VLTFVVWPLLAAFAMERVVRRDEVSILGCGSLPVGVVEIRSTFVVVSLTALGESSPGWLACVGAGTGCFPSGSGGKVMRRAVGANLMLRSTEMEFLPGQ